MALQIVTTAKPTVWRVSRRFAGGRDPGARLRALIQAHSK